MIGTRFPSATVEPTATDLQYDELDHGVHSELEDRTAPITVTELATRLVERIDGERDAARTRIRLHHVVLPKLADAGMVAYEAGDHLVSARADVTGVGDRE